MDVTSSIAIGLLHNADPAVQAGIECVKQWLVFWQNSEYVRTRVRRGRRLSFEVLRDGSSRSMKVRGPVRAVMCVLFCWRIVILL